MIMYKMSETKEQLLEDYSIYIFSRWFIKLLHTTINFRTLNN